MKTYILGMCASALLCCASQPPRLLEMQREADCEEVARQCGGACCAGITAILYCYCGQKCAACVCCCVAALSAKEAVAPVVKLTRFWSASFRDTCCQRKRD